MVFNTATVGAAVTPTVVETFVSHYTNRKAQKQKPTADVSYHIGLKLIRRFLLYASHHTVDDIQGFTGQWVPSPHWVRTEDFEIAADFITKAVEHVKNQLGEAGIEQIGGPTWWQWRRKEIPLRAEWIEMRKDYNARKHSKESCTRSMMYVHGGAYFFGSVDEHRYQLQRHARKLNARVLAPRYRLAPQFPFPCGLLDCLAAYLYLLTVQPPETIILAGDSAGGGMIVSLMIILRDQGIPLPAGAVLISPWVDLTHSFPSVAGQNDFDYVPPYGFLQRPSLSWPPPNSDDLKALDDEEESGKPAEPHSTRPGRGKNLSITIDGELIELKDQIQMYTTNSLIGHPLVSPVLQPSLGGLPPMLILTGGGEMLRDEQIYLAHKAAAPSDYPSPLASSAPYADTDIAHKYPPTNVQLQVWDDLCHVAPTLSFTRPAKFMYRSIAQFGAWALARAQKTEIEILDDDEVSVISSATSESSYSRMTAEEKAKHDAQKVDERRTRKDDFERSGVIDGNASTSTLNTAVGKAGDPLPPFVSHMIRQRVTRNGEVFPLPRPSNLAACTMTASEIGTIKPGPVRKWLAQQKVWNAKYARQKKRVQELRLKEMQKTKSGGYVGAGADERPPPTAYAGRRQDTLPKVPKRRKAMGLALWSGWGSKHDEDTLEKQQEKDKNPEENVETAGVVAKGQNGMGGAAHLDVKNTKSKSRSRVRSVSDEGQAGTQPEKQPANIDAVIAGAAGAGTAAGVAANTIGSDTSEKKIEDSAEVGNLTTANTRKDVEESGVSSSSPALERIGSIAEQSTIRPAAGDAAFPFKLARPKTGERNPSMITLESHPGVIDAPTITKATTSDESAVVDEDTQLTPKKASTPTATPNGLSVDDVTPRKGFNTTSTKASDATPTKASEIMPTKASEITPTKASEITPTKAPTTAAAATAAAAVTTAGATDVALTHTSPQTQPSSAVTSKSLAGEIAPPNTSGVQRQQSFDYGAETETDGSMTPRADDEVPTVFNGEIILPGDHVKRPEMSRFVTADEEIETSEGIASTADSGNTTATQ